MKTVVPDLPIITLSQPPNLCSSLCRAKLRHTSAIDDPPRPSQSCGKSRLPCLSLICSNYITNTPLIITPLNVITKILVVTLNGLFMLFLVPSVSYDTCRTDHVTASHFFLFSRERSHVMKKLKVRRGCTASRPLNWPSTKKSDGIKSYRRTACG